MEEIYANIDYLKSGPPDPQAPRQGEPGQPEGDLNHCRLSSPRLPSGSWSSEGSLSRYLLPCLGLLSLVLLTGLVVVGVFCESGSRLLSQALTLKAKFTKLLGPKQNTPRCGAATSQQEAPSCFFTAERMIIFF